ncbi:MAG: acetoin:2,6-dichlorophenolindophenol oxidoreductase subunit alpha [Solirubrobacterales bacterium]|jgi:pyruvate dehydrogenase E1 component alpha subunit|nr:acetoin:2,6-dichlorophenolindophenol oxidoreductase subunit alpha [Solirubrobacterales bacterium]
MEERERLVRELGPEWMQALTDVRVFEQQLAEMHKAGSAVLGAVHLGIGQEAVAVGVCHQLIPGDQITVSHRGHGPMLARGLDPERMYAEILGRASGYCGGKGGSMHIACPELGVAGANGIVGGGIPMALGIAKAARELGTGNVGVPIFGDGASNTGSFAETMNLAAVWKAPVVFVCENNGYTEFTATEEVTAGPGIYTRGEGYGVPGVAVDGEDVVAVHIEMAGALARARAGEGPTLLECRTVRWHGHHEGDERYAGEYRPEPVRDGDPIARLAREMDELGLEGEAVRERAAADARQRLGAALEAALEAPEPELETALTGVYV